jgi:hypothetical protein
MVTVLTVERVEIIKIKGLLVVVLYPSDLKNLFGFRFSRVSHS